MVVMFSLWLEPDSETSSLLQSLMKPLAQRAGTPMFPPHITVASGQAESEDAMAKQCVPMGLSEKTLILQADTICCSNAFFRSVYLSLQKSPELEACHRVATRVWNSKGLWEPHISLVYSDVPLNQKLAWVQGLTVPSQPLIFSKWTLRGPKPGSTWRDLESWRRWK